MPNFTDFLPVIASTAPRIKLTGFVTPDWVFLRRDLDGYTLSVDYNAGMSADEPVLESICEAYILPSDPEIEDDVRSYTDSRVLRKFIDQELDEIESAMRPFLPAIEPLVIKATPYTARPEAWGGPKRDTDDEDFPDDEDLPSDAD